MKKLSYISILLAALALTGAGCQQSTENNDEVNSNVNIEVKRAPEVNINDDINVDIKSDDEIDAKIEIPEVDVKADENAELKIEAPVASAPETKTFNLTLQKFSFSPSTIEVNEGDIVVVNATASDTTHGFSLPEFGVDLVIPQGTTQTATFTASKKGTFTFRCSVYCGVGHSSMTGTLIVK